MSTHSLTPLYPIESSFGGALGSLLDGLTNQWLLVAPIANPAMLEMFSDRDHPPYRALLPWSGEFAGKYLTSAVQVWRLGRDPRLKAWLEQFVAELIRRQDSDGYLGPWPAGSRLTNFSAHHGSQDDSGSSSPGGARGMGTWDTWGHYHIMTGLLLWHTETGDPAALECVRRIADLLCQKYLGRPEVRLVETGFSEMNLAPAHALGWLYRLTGAGSYLDLARQIVDEFAAQDEHGPLAGDYLNGPLAGKAFYELPKPRWESLHPIMALVELYSITGEPHYRQAFEAIWWSILEGDRHNNGGFSSGEQATGNPYDPAPIETCCTIAWLALSVEMLKLAGSSIVADEIELSTLNSGLGMHSPSGRWATYNTPSDGARFASAHHIVFQARSGSPELNCCSVNSPRSLGLISEWAAMQDREALVLNYYGPSRLRLPLRDGLVIDLHQETDYPIGGKIILHIDPSRPAEFPLRLRIPSWSAETLLGVNGEPQAEVAPGQYFEIRREWAPGDVVELELDLSLHFWNGERQCQGLASIYRGPLLLAYDARYNPASPTQALPEDLRAVTADRVQDLLPVSVLNGSTIASQPSAWEGWYPPQLLLRFQTTTGQPAYLCDFASAGLTGTPYRTWLPVAHPARPAAGKRSFTRANPLRSWR